CGDVAVGPRAGPPEDGRRRRPMVPPLRLGPGGGRHAGRRRAGVRRRHEAIVVTSCDHVRALQRALVGLDAEFDRIETWGRTLASVLGGGGRLLVAGNGGSAAQAQHLTSELVGRYDTERDPLSAIALHAET